VILYLHLVPGAGFKREFKASIPQGSLKPRFHPPNYRTRKHISKPIKYLCNSAKKVTKGKKGENDESAEWKATNWWTANCLPLLPGLLPSLLHRHRLQVRFVVKREPFGRPPLPQRSVPCNLALFLRHYADLFTV
jgi:hypothetical protein